MSDHPAVPDPFEAAVPVALRRVAPPEAPWPAALVRAESGTAFLVEESELPPGAGPASDEHVARAQEVYRLPSGHALVMPHVARPLRAQDAADPGAAVTLAVSLLRGILEAGDLPGQWWLTSGGRPLFVPVAGGEPAATSAAALMRAAAAGLDVLAELADALVDLDRRDAGDWEARLFAAHEPGPIGAPPGGGQPRRRDRTARAPAPSRLLRAVDTSLAETVSDAGTALWRALRRRERPRRAVVVGVAVAAAALVVVLGTTWPGGETAAPVDEVAAIGGSVPEAGPDDPAERARGLLLRLRGCADAACRADLLEQPSASLPPGAALGAATPAVTLVDDLGGIVVVRVDDRTGSQPPQIVLLVARDGKWLVRDVYDAADQP